MRAAARLDAGLLSVLGLCMHAWLWRALSFCGMWDVIMQYAFFGDAPMEGRYLEGVAFVVLCGYIGQDVFRGLVCWFVGMRALFFVDLDALFTL